MPKDSVRSVTVMTRQEGQRSDAYEFVAKLGGALQETDETSLWLELLREDCGIQATENLER